MNSSTSRVLFVCIDNTILSRLAEALLVAAGRGRYAVTSAGFTAAPADGAVIDALAQVGLQLHNTSAQQTVDEHFVAGASFDYVVFLSVNDDLHDLECPLFAGELRRLTWRLPAPLVEPGNAADDLASACALRDAIQMRINTWLSARYSIRPLPGERSS